MRGFQFEHLSTFAQVEITDWLLELYGPPTKDTWYVDVQPMMEDLVVNEKIATMYALRWM